VIENKCSRERNKDFYFLWGNSASGLRSGLRSRRFENSRLHTHTHAKCRTPLYEGSARRRDSYLHNTQQIQETNIHAVTGFSTREPTNQAAVELRLRSLGRGIRTNSQGRNHTIKYYIVRVAASIVKYPSHCLALAIILAKHA
jgi:hypothetical protein